MDTSTLTSLGLTKSQAKAYIVLIQSGSITPPELASKIKETRSNTYKILDRLDEMGLATKSESAKKIVYRASNPVALEELAKKQRDETLAQERQIKQSMPSLLNYFYTYSEQPGIRFFQGKNGIKQILDDMLRTRQTICLIRSPADVAFYDEPFFEEFKKKRAQLGIKTHALTPDTPTANRDPKIDKANLFIRTWLPAGSYDGSADWYVYGDKVAIISYGEEGIGMIIESPIIADGFKQLFSLLQAAHSTSA
jgi:sugar-specific transcriptional regulator TrmB